jgi:hypothetical protein
MIINIAAANPWIPTLWSSFSGVSITFTSTIFQASPTKKLLVGSRSPPAQVGHFSLVAEGTHKVT